MKVPADVETFWNDFAVSQLDDPTSRFYEAFHFDDNEPSANELGQLVLAGKKRATAGLVWSFENASAPLPKVGDLSVVTNWSKEPLCVIETQRVDIVPFNEVSAEFAATEGEGDGSLAYWRLAHTAYFERECQRIGRVFDPKMPVVCERFAVVYRGADGRVA
ncbi:MAG: ASCH domain-containing protein [Betaproteobacteria bacterium]